MSLCQLDRPLPDNVCHSPSVAHKKVQLAQAVLQPVQPSKTQPCWCRSKVNRDNSFMGSRRALSLQYFLQGNGNQSSQVMGRRLTSIALHLKEGS